MLNCPYFKQMYMIARQTVKDLSNESVNLVHAVPSFLFKIHFTSSHLCLGLTSGFFPSASPTNTLYKFLFKQNIYQ